MQTLRKEFWKNFKSDGLLFEELVWDILKVEYPNHSFQRTPHSHDGARDFECELPMLSGANARMWIECKYHQERLPVNAVAMTMVMAILDQSKQIIFFSYSPVKRTFIDYTARFQRKTGIDVKVYDDCVLEELIVKCWDKLDTKKYFNVGSKFSVAEKHHAIEVQMDVIKVGYCGTAAIEGRPVNEKDCFYLNDTAEVRFSFRNTSATQKYSVHLEMEPEHGSPFFSILDHSFQKKKSCDFELSCGAVHQFCLPLKLVRFREKVFLPRFTVHFDNEAQRIPRKSIRARWIAEAPLIGQTYHDAVIEAEKLLSASSQLAWVKVSGRSGVGKSRLLKELCSLRGVYSNQAIFINAESRPWSFQEVIQTLVSELTHLPVAKDKQIFPIRTIETDGNGYAAKVLYDPFFSCVDEWKKLAFFTAKLLARKKFFFVIDNAQDCDAPTLRFLNAVLDECSDRPGVSAVFLCFNEDRLFPGTEAWILSHRLSSLAAQNPQAFLDIWVKGFSEQEALHYLNECLNWPELEQINIPETLRLLIRQSGTEPLYLQNMLLYLVQERILERTQTASFYVSDPAAFHRMIGKLPKTLDSLLSKREKVLISQMSEDPDKKESYLNGMRLVAAFPHLPVFLFRDITRDPDLEEELILLGLLQENTDGTISFRHQLLKKYFQAHYPLKKAPNNLLSRIEACIERRGLERELAQGLFLLENILGKIKPDIWKTVMEQIEAGYLDHTYSRALIPELFKRAPKENITLTELLSLYRKGCWGITHHFGLEEGLPSFELACRDILERKTFFSGMLEDSCAIIREYENGLLNFGWHQKAEELLRQTEAFLNETPSTDPAWSRTQVSFAISSCVAYNALGLFEQGKTAAERAIELARDAGDLRRLIQAHVEYGYLYYYSENAAECIPEIREQWKTAYDLWKSQYFPDRPKDNPATDHMTNAVLMTAMLGDLSGGEMAAAADKARQIQKMLNHTGMPFYEAKLRLSLCCYEVISRYKAPIPLGDEEELLNMLHQSIDKCIAYCLTRDYPACYYLLAVVHLISGKTQLAMDNYLKAIAAAQKYIKTPQQARQWKYLFFDAAYRLRMQGIQSKQPFDQIEAPDIRQECFSILATRDKESVDWEFPRLSPLCLPSGINLPKV